MTNIQMNVKNINHMIILLLFLPVQLHPQTLSQIQAENFIKSLINEDTNLYQYLDPHELQLSDRFGIQYEKVEQKFLISYDLDYDLKEDIRNKKLKYEIEIQRLHNEFSRIQFIIPEKNYQKDFYFKAHNLISPISYYTRDWSHLESKHFNFIISDTSYWNSYCVDNLEQFYIKISELLGFTKEQEEKIQSEKIYYFLCKDEKEIKQLTGFNTRGMYNIAYDFVITTFNAHYHELIHFLINYKLKSLPLYTHPFLREGFAVAFGGRGGKEPRVILSLGFFLYKSKMLDYFDLLNKNSYYKYDASMSYPVSGLYNYFLIEELGIERYLSLYIKYSGTYEDVSQMNIVQDDLPTLERWQEFLNEFKENKTIGFDYNCPQVFQILHDTKAEILENCDRYYFSIKDTLIISSGDEQKRYKSRKFEEIFPNKRYNGEKYLIMASNDEISVYNLYTNCLIANFVSAFSEPVEIVPLHDGFYKFSVPKRIFDEEFRDIFKNMGSN